MDLHLLRPYAFTHLPSPTSSRRSSPVQSQVVRNPETGNDHLIMRFWIHGRGLDEPNTTTGWLKARWREGKIWVKQAVREMGSDSLEGQTVVNEGDRSVTTTVKPQEEQGWFSSLFGALRPSLPRTQTMGTPKKNLPPAGTYRSAEGRVDFFRNPETEAYEMLTLTVDVPGGRRPNQRAVLHWSEPGQVAEEGILEGKRHKITF
jgi:import inner membrane translocase subunit TIM21